MARYASRKTPSEGVVVPLHAKALALRDGQGRTLLWITTDSVGFDRAFIDRVIERLQKEHGLARESVTLFSSHTHQADPEADRSSPEQRRDLPGFPGVQKQRRIPRRPGSQDGPHCRRGPGQTPACQRLLQRRIGDAGFAMYRRPTVSRSASTRQGRPITESGLARDRQGWHDYGRELAKAVEAAMSNPQLTLEGRLAAAYAEPLVPCAGPTDRASIAPRMSSASASPTRCDKPTPDACSPPSMPGSRSAPGIPTPFRRMPRVII